MEKWRSVPGFKGAYFVSNKGRVKSYKTGKEKFLRFNMASRYPRVRLCNGPHVETWDVHRLVYSVFVGLIPPGKCVRHLNDMKTDNRLENLAIGTNADNARDRARNNLMPKGEDHHRAKLTDDIVIEMRKMFRKGLSAVHISKIFGVDSSVAHAAIRGKTWSHVPNPVIERLPGPNRKIHDEIALAMKIEREKGATFKEIAAKHSISAATAYRRIKAIS